MTDEHGRQWGGALDEIERSHVARYEWAGRVLRDRGNVIRVLDAGCGCGYGTAYLAGLGFNAVGIDSSRAGIRWANEHFPGPRYEVADLYAWAAADFVEQFDAVVCFETLEHLQRPADVVAGLWRAAPLWIASTPDERQYPFADTRPAGHVRHYTPDEFEALIGGAVIARGSHDKGQAVGPAGAGRYYLIAAERCPTP